jgi:hypothetical protein
MSGGGCAAGTQPPEVPYKHNRFLSKYINYLGRDYRTLTISWRLLLKEKGDLRFSCSHLCCIFPTSAYELRTSISSYFIHH